MDWLVYWFMLPVCVCVASIAMFSGISGAALLMPVFLFGFPLIGAPAMSTVSAIGMSLFLETSGFGTGVYRYVRARLVDWKTVSTLAVVTVPFGVAGALAARSAPVYLLRSVYGVVMVGLAMVMWRHRPSSIAAGFDVGPFRTVVAATGDEYRYPVPSLVGQRVASAADEEVELVPSDAMLPLDELQAEPEFVLENVEVGTQPGLRSSSSLGQADRAGNRSRRATRRSGSGS